MALDASLFQFLNAFVGQSPALDGTIVFFASSLAYVLVAVFLGFLFFSQYPRRKKIEIFLVALVSSVIARAGVTELIRFFYHRPRPFLTLPTHQLLTDSAWSFPSGHATFFFALAMAVYLYDKRWGRGFLVAAALMTLARVIAGVHYVSDIIAGAIIGVGTTYFVVFLARRLWQAEREPDLLT